MKKHVIEYNFDGDGEWMRLKEEGGIFQHKRFSLSISDYKFRVVEVDEPAFAVDQELTGRHGPTNRRVVAIMKDSRTPTGEAFISYLVRLHDPVDDEIVYSVHTEQRLLELYGPWSSN